jgi:WD40 repeat protein
MWRKIVTGNRSRLIALFFAVVLSGAAGLPRSSAEEPPTKPAALKAAKDRYGDALPPGALARFGTVRWRVGREIGLLSFADAGKVVVARETTGRIHVLDTASGKELHRLGRSQAPETGGADSPSTSVISPDGRFMANFGGETQDLFVWEIASGKELWKQQRKQQALQPVAFTADGRTLALWDDPTLTLSLRETTTGKELGKLPPVGGRVGVDTDGPFLPRVAFSPDGTALAALGPDGVVSVFRVLTRKLIGTFGPATDFRTAQHATFQPAFSADSKQLTTLAVVKEQDRTSGTVTTWDLETGKPVRQIKDPGGGGADALLSPDGAVIAWLCAGSVLHLLDATTGKERIRLGGDGVAFSGLPIFSPDGKLLLGRLRESDKRVRVWNAATGKELWTCRCSSWPCPAAFSPDGKALVLFDALRSGGMIRILDAATGKELGAGGGHEGSIVALSVADDGKTVTTLAEDNTLRQWEFSSAELRRVSLSETAAMSPDGQWVAVARGTSGARQLEITNLRANAVVRNVAVTGGEPIRLVWAPGAKTLGAVCQKEESINYFFRLYDVATGAERRLVDEPKSHSPDDVLFSPDGTIVATHWSNDRDSNVVYLSEVSSGKAVHRLNLPRGTRALTLAFSPDGRTLAMLYSIRAPQTIAFWETATGLERGRIKGGAISFDAAALTFSPDGNTIAAGCADDAICLWSARTGKVLGRLAGHQGGVTCLAFSRDGRTLFSGGKDTSALVWDLGPVLRQHPAPLIDLDAKELESFWIDLADEDAHRAFLAMTLLGSAKQWPDWARERIKPVARVEPERLAQLIVDLHDNTFAVHDGARVELEKLRELARPTLEQALRNKPPAEPARRIQHLLDRLAPGHELPGEVVRMMRAVEALEMLGTPEAKRLLKDLGAGNPDANLTRECNAAEKRLTSSGK